jgi:hypothetical protein
MEERSASSGAPTFLPGKSGEEAWTRREERDIIGLTDSVIPVILRNRFASWEREKSCGIFYRVVFDSTFYYTTDPPHAYASISISGHATLYP